MVDKLRVGIIGLGRISTLHLSAYLPEVGIDAELVSVCDKNKKAVKEVVSQFNLDPAKCYTDYKDLLQDPSIDAIEILLPHNMHEKVTIDAANAGKHISLQKVPAMSLSEMDNMIKAAKKAKVHFRVAENFRFYEPYMQALDLIEKKTIGKVERVDYKFWAGLNTLSHWNVPIKSNLWRITEKANYKGPTIFDDGYHKHSIIARFLNEPIDSVIAWQGNYHIKAAGIPTPIKYDTPAVIIYTCKNKSHYGTWSASVHDFFPMHSKYYNCDEYVEIIGEKGAIFVPGCTGSWFKNCTGAPGKEGVHWCDESGEWHSDYSGNSDWGNSFINSTRNFIEGIKTGKQSDLSPEEARYILQIGLAVVRSTREKFREVKLKEITDRA
ncbi:MAG: Gfo/Idh/MocA family protein [Promethearchaeota archaeon]